ncbi:MAG: cobalamin-binding protein [Clostridiales bacterium GWB2_37_7]|nr:MAG: cobalamin-binding protein [Clostridiales bacterium GWB2_37_7]
MSKLFLQLADAVVEMDEAKSSIIAQKIINEKLNLLEAIEHGLVYGMSRAGDLFEAEEYFIPELLMCADAMDAAMKTFIPHIKVEKEKSKGRIVIGTIFGDTHDIGKNIVALIIKSAGFDVLDLGRDVTAREFVDAAIEFKADIIAVSTLMTTTMENMAEVIKLLNEEGKRDLFKVIIGGKPVSSAFAKKIGADAYASNAGGALRAVKSIISQSIPE